MSRIFRYIIKLGVLYLGINWIADHPHAVRYVCDTMNHYVSVGIDEANNLLTTL